MRTLADLPSELQVALKEYVRRCIDEHQETVNNNRERFQRALDAKDKAEDELVELLVNGEWDE